MRLSDGTPDIGLGPAGGDSREDLLLEGFTAVGEASMPVLLAGGSLSLAMVAWACTPVVANILKAAANHAESDGLADDAQSLRALGVVVGAVSTVRDAVGIAESPNALEAAEQWAENKMIVAPAGDGDIPLFQNPDRSHQPDSPNT